jgi:hypothetical protein
MARPLSDSHRRIAIGLLGQYVGPDHRCLRDVVGWLTAGPDSTRTGLMRVHVGALVDDLGWTKPQVVAALNRLQSEGLIIWHEPLRIVLCWFVLRTVTVSVENHRKSYLAQCQTFADCLARSEAIKTLQAIVIVSRDGVSKAPSHGALHGAQSGASHSTSQDSGFRDQDSGSFTVAKATATLALPDVTRLALPMEAEPQADEVDPFANQPDPWANIKPTVIDEVDLDYRPEVKLTPIAQAKRDAADAARQQTLTLTAPKPSKTLTPGQQDAIFAKKRMAATVDLWNELLGKKSCGPCSHKEVAKMATQLMQNLAKYVSSEPGCDGSALIGWAAAKSEYHSGRSGKRTWTLQQWLTTEHLAQVFADYRNERGDERKIRYLPERTLRDWREAEETREAWVNSQQGQVAA